jgi:hypothetical protein
MDKKDLLMVFNIVLGLALLIFAVLTWSKFNQIEARMATDSKPVTVVLVPTPEATATPSVVGEDSQGDEAPVAYPTKAMKRAYPAVAAAPGFRIVVPGPLGVGWKTLDRNLAAGGRLPGVIGFKGKLWLIGGLGTQESMSTTDGVHWDTQADGIGLAASSASGVAELNGYLWVAGGQGQVIRSQDGAHWEEVTHQAGFGNRSQAHLVSFKQRLWMIAGSTSHGLANDVWSSADGADWKCETAAAPFCPRRIFGACEFDDKLWVIGGFGPGGYDAMLNDIWSSSDGVHWEEVHAGPHFRGRGEYPVFSGGGKIWVVGGDEGNFSWPSDVWCSSDGLHWDCLRTSIPGFSGIGHGGYYYQDHLWILGGDGTPVWCSPGN